MRTAKLQRTILNKVIKNKFFNKREKQEAELVYANSENMKEYLEYYQSATRWV